MLKTITLGDKEMKITSSALTPFSYKDLTGRDMLPDIAELEEAMNTLQDKSDKDQIMTISSLLETLLRLAYVMNSEADSTAPGWKEWLKGIKHTLKDRKWIKEVLEVASSCFLGSVEEQPTE